MPVDLTTLVIDVGGSRTRIALVRDGVIGPRSTHLTLELAEPGIGVAGRLVKVARALIEEAGAPAIAAVGVALAAMVDDFGSVLQPRDFGIPAGRLLHDRLVAEFGVPVAIGNDANLAALAEYRLGAARGHQTAAILTLGTNIGLGLILNGQFHRGAHGAAGEAGLLLVPAVATGEWADHRPVVDAGRLGRGASAAPAGYAFVEELVGGEALASAADRVSGASVSAGSPRRVFTPEALADPALRPIVDRAIEGWALVIANLSVVLDVGVVVLTGGLAADAAHLLPQLQRRVAELVAFVPEIRLGRCGADAELLGADLKVRAALDGGAAFHARAGLSAQITGES